MTKIIITNDFTYARTIVDASKPLTKAKIKAIRRRLCSDDCVSGDVLGARGQQPPEYAALRDRAEQIMLTGCGK
jgi:hypothetical protein